MDNVRDLMERAAWTFAQSFLAVFVIGDMGTLKVALVGGAAAALSVLKTCAKGRVG